MPLVPIAVVRAPTVTVLSRPSFTEAAHLTVQWIGEATDGERLAAYAGRLRASSQANPAERATREYLQQLPADELGRLQEHAHYTLLIEGVSRALVHELVHELVHDAADCRWTERSPRYVEADALRFVLPPAIIGDAALESAWSERMAAALGDYATMVDLLMTRYAWINDKVQRRKMAREAAGGVLPQSTETAVMLTGSTRALRAFIAHGASEVAELELRRLSLAMLTVLLVEAPALFNRFTTFLASDRFEAARDAVVR